MRQQNRLPVLSEKKERETEPQGAKETERQRDRETKRQKPSTNEYKETRRHG